jgi:hypothetical protein
MPLPTLSDVHVNRPLTSISIAFMQQLESFVAASALPIVPVAKKSDVYFQYDRSYWYRNEMQKRAPSSESAGAGFALSTDSYSCDVWALHKDIDDQIRGNADAPLQLDRDAAEFLSLQALLNMESEFMTNLFTTGIWTGSSTGSDITPGTLWDNSGNPLVDIRNQMRSMKQKTGYKPNLFVCGSQAWTEGIENNSAVLDTIKYTQRGLINPEIFATAIGVDKVIVAEATQNTTAEGGTASYSFLATNEDCALYYVEPNPSIMKPSAFYGFAWTGFLGAGAMGQRIKRFRMDPLSSDRIEMEQAFDMKLVAADLGVYFDAVITP